MKSRLATIIILAIAAFPILAAAQTAYTSDNSSLIASLKAEVVLLTQELQALILAHQAAPFSSTPSSPPCRIIRSLSLGATGADVTCVQKFLISQNFLPPEDATGYYGLLTQSAVQQFQSSRGIISSGTPFTTGYGAVGPRTLTAILTIISSTASIGSPSSSTATTSSAGSNSSMEGGGGSSGGSSGGGGGGGGNSPSAPSCTLSASPASVVMGTNSTISWVTTNATAASISSIGNVSSVGSGSMTITPAITTDYTMTVSSNGMTSTCNTRVTVIAVPSPKPDIIWDMISGLGTTTPAQLGVFRDVHYGTSTGCIFSYNLGGTPSASLSLIPDTSSTWSVEQAMPWKLVSWNWVDYAPTILSQDLPNVCAPETVASSTKSSVSLSIAYKNQTAEGFAIAPQYIVLHENSVPYYEKMFGGLYYSKLYDANKVQVPWPFFMIGNQFPFRYLSNYSSMMLTLTTTLRVASIRHTLIQTTSIVPVGATTTYNAGVNATRFEFYLDVRWHPKYCTNQILHTDPNCVAYWNKPLEIQVELYDDRWPYWTGPALRADQGTGGSGNLYIYHLSAHDLIGGSTTINPFEIVGNPATIHTDILPILDKILLSTRAQSDTDGINYVPPRLILNGVPETDDQYLADFAINNYSLGYENSGLGDISYEISAFSLVGTPKQ